MQIGNNSKEERYMDANTVSLQRQVPMRLCCRDVCRWTLARASLQGWTPQYNQWLVASKKKKTKNKKTKKKKTKQNKEEEERNKSDHGKDYEKKMKRKDLIMHEKGAIGVLGLAMWESNLKVMRSSILLSAPLIDQNENNLWPAHREIVRRFRVATWALKVQRTKKAKRISFTKT